MNQAIAALQPQLRVFRKLDVNRLSEEFVEKIGQDEGGVEYVDANRARDFEWTQEIMSATIGAALVDDQGNILREWTGPEAFLSAEKARSSARVVFDVDLGDDDLA